MINFVNKIDKKILLYINKNHKNVYLDFFYKSITNLSSNFFIFLLIFYFIFFPPAKHKYIAYYIAASLFISGSVVYIMKRLIRRKRPYENLPEIETIKIGVDAYSFPSGHSSAAFTLGVLFSLISTNYLFSVFFIILSILVAFSRIYLGVHYLSDTLAGSLIGTLSSLFIYKLFIY